MKTLCVPLVLCLFSGLVAPVEELRYAPEDGTTLTRTFEAHAELGPGEAKGWINGQELEGAEQGSFEFLERIVVRDRIEGVEEGRPTALVRTFVELLQESTYTLDDEETEETSTSDLEGRSVRFVWDDEEEGYVAEVADEEGELDADLLEGLREDLDLRGILPDDEVEEGDEWEVEPEVYIAFMWPSGLLDFHAEGEEIDDSIRELNQGTIDGIAGKCTARFAGVRDEDGVRVAVLAVEFDVETHAEITVDDEGASLETQLSVERELEGEILWDLEHGHVHSAALSGSSERTTKRKGTLEHEEAGEVTLEEEVRHEGTIEYTVSIERE
jgi:hypothetical protein